MFTTVTKTEGPAAVTVLRLEGKLDGANYENLIEEAEKLLDAGTRDLLLDLSGLTFISSAGLVGLHQVALLFRGAKYPDHEDGWAAYHAINRDRSQGTQDHVKLLSPISAVRGVLEMTGFDSLFEIYDALPQALASFNQPKPAALPA